MTHHRTLSEMEGGNDEERLAARRRIEEAEDFRAHYRSRMNTLQETYLEVARRHDVADAPAFREAMRRVSDEAEENLHGAGRVIAGMEEDYDALLAQQSREREQFLEQRRREE